MIQEEWNVDIGMKYKRQASGTGHTIGGQVPARDLRFTFTDTGLIE